MTDCGFSNATLEQIHWLSLYLRLPEGGVAEEFPTESACEDRFQQVRWPDGPICPGCAKKDFNNLTSEKFYPCRNCKTQFSDTSGTILHRRRLDLSVYFGLAAEIVGHQKIRSVPSGHDIKDRFKLAYATAVRLKKSITNSLTETNGGLLGRCICVRDLPVPQHIDLGSEDHLIWLQGEDQRRRQ